ncbi:MAG: ABC transporter ATP-binding protein [Anaerolineales bacterium]|nr:ABC transporter ATP-binding protein [Anaerolineales bacterium]
MSYALETKSLSKIYHSDSLEIRAVDDVSIGIEPGEFVALVGPSGSGKTTMLAMLAGLLQPSEGEALINGADFGRLSEKELTKFRLKNIGFTFQSNNLVPYLTALENVELMLQLNGKFDRKGKERAKELLVRLGLKERLHNLPSQLSGGQQQRVAIARSLVHDPQVVLADEPTASLDTERAYQVVETFAELIHEQNRAGIMVTHDLRMCAYVDRVIQMIDGRLARIITEPAEIEAFANASKPNKAVKENNGRENGSIPQKQRSSYPVAVPA